MTIISKGKERKKPHERRFPVAFQWKPVHVTVELIVLRLFKKRRKTHAFDEFLCFCQRFSDVFLKIKGTAVPLILFRSRNFWLLVVDEQGHCAIRDGVFIDDHLGNILLVRQVEHHIHQ